MSYIDTLISKILSKLLPQYGESFSEIDCGGVIWSRENINATKRAGGKWTSGTKIPCPGWREY